MKNFLARSSQNGKKRGINQKIREIKQTKFRLKLA